MINVAVIHPSLPRSVPLLICLCLTISCNKLAGRSSPPAQTADNGAAIANAFDEYLSAETLPADGFEFPFGRGDGSGSYTDIATGKRFAGWYVATHFGEQYSLGIHPGEDWNGNGGANTDLGQDVFAVANGRVVFAADCGRLWGNVIMIEHVFYENQEKKKIRSLYAHLLQLKVRKDQQVRRRERIATIGQDPEKLFDAHLHLELRWDETLEPTYWPSSNRKEVSWVREHYAEPTAFIRSHAKLPVPQAEPELILVDQASYKMRFYKKAVLQKEYEVSFGQGSGQKLVEGDNKTPVGMYFVIQKHQGTFDGPYGAYFGGHWIKINYPNQFDASRARDERLISPGEAATISRDWTARASTAQNTGLGGGIGFHGWIREWSNDGPRHLSWDCIVMHPDDIAGIFDRVPEGTMVVIF